MDINQVKTNMDKALAHLKEGLNKVRTGRATPSLVEDMQIEVYGSRQPLKGLASISTPSPREILISPWDKSSVAEIIKAIESSDLGLNPVSMGEQIKLSLPELTAERREELIKVVNSQAEEARISLRNIREDFLQALKSKVEEDNLGDDELEKGKKEVQKIIDEMNETVKTLTENKTEEISKI